MKKGKEICDAGSATYGTSSARSRKHAREQTSYSPSGIVEGTEAFPVIISEETSESAHFGNEEKSVSVEQLEILDEMPLAMVSAGQPLPVTDSELRRAELKAALLYYDKQMAEASSMGEFIPQDPSPYFSSASVSIEIEGWYQLPEETNKNEGLEEEEEFSRPANLDDFLPEEMELEKPNQEEMQGDAGKGKAIHEESEKGKERVDKYKEKQEELRKKLIKQMMSPLLYYSNRKGPTQRKYANKIPPGMKAPSPPNDKN